eukprot:gene630-2064_t
MGGGGVDAPDFPTDFQKGVGLSVWQNSSDTTSNWSHFAKKKNYFGQKGLKEAWLKSNDFWNLYEADIGLARQQIGATSFRFSFEWSRLQPHGPGEFDPEAVEKFHKLINCTIIASNGHDTFNHYVPVDAQSTAQSPSTPFPRGRGDGARLGEGRGSQPSAGQGGSSHRMGGLSIQEVEAGGGNSEEPRVHASNLACDPMALAALSGITALTLGLCVTHVFVEQELARPPPVHDGGPPGRTYSLRSRGRCFMGMQKAGNESLLCAAQSSMLGSLTRIALQSQALRLIT